MTLTFSGLTPDVTKTSHESIRVVRCIRGFKRKSVTEYEKRKNIFVARKQ